MLRVVKSDRWSKAYAMDNAQELTRLASHATISTCLLTVWVTASNQSNCDHKMGN